MKEKEQKEASKDEDEHYKKNEHSIKSETYHSHAETTDLEDEVLKKDT